RNAAEEREYELELEIVSLDGTAGRQRVMAGENFELAVLAGEAPARSGYRKLPAESYRDGQLTVRVIAETRGGAAVSQIWLKETGASFAVQADDGTPAAPESFSLEQNYPNPFNPSTHIRFRLAMDARVTLEVFNLLGQKVRRLASSQYPAGAHTVVWDGLSDAGTPAASGIYFYRLSAGEFVQSRRMLLLR
ncbi:MAG: T9SS type A sorting domain-containing protein, partial [Candidatus Cloacimonetes bacterium]|nr:T9SS type A sorting domain-containing protein [Candidatus Cloacimonadota bacterium]